MIISRVFTLSSTAFLHPNRESRIWRGGNFIGGLMVRTQQLYHPPTCRCVPPEVFPSRSYLGSSTSHLCKRIVGFEAIGNPSIWRLTSHGTQVPYFIPSGSGAISSGTYAASFWLLAIRGLLQRGQINVSVCVSWIMVVERGADRGLYTS